MFYGKECPHCHIMMPRALKLAKERKIKIKKFEVWHNNKNAALMRSYALIIKPSCGGELGVPSFVDTESKRVLCGKTNYKTFKLWATKK